MALYTPAPSYPTPHLERRPSHSPARHVTRSERMLMATLRRDHHSQNAPDGDYFMDASGSKSPSPPHLLSPPAYDTGASRSPSPVARRGRTPSPSPHPYYRANLARTQTAPSRSHYDSSSRPSTPSRRATSPVHQRDASGSSQANAKRTGHEELLRSRLQDVLARQQQLDATAAEASSSVSNTTHARSRGPSFSRTAPPQLPGLVGTHSTTATGDQWAWSQSQSTTMRLPPSPKIATRRSPSVTRAAGSGTPQRITSSSQLSSMVSPTRIRESVMPTPPPSPPHAEQAEPTSPTLSQAPSLGMGHPSTRSSSKSPSSGSTSVSPSCRVTPPPFDARAASLTLKQQPGYVSFCDIQGLGEPEGMDGDDSDGEDGEDGRGRGRWWFWK